MPHIPLFLPKNGLRMRLVIPLSTPWVYHTLPALRYTHPGIPTMYTLRYTHPGIPTMYTPWVYPPCTHPEVYPEVHPEV